MARPSRRGRQAARPASGLTRSSGPPMPDPTPADAGSPTNVTVTIVATEELEDLKACLETVWSQSIAASIDVVVVDNGSTDGSSEWLAGLGDRIRVITSPVKLGFCAAANLGINAAGGELILNLTPDVRLGSRYVEECAAAMSKDPTVGITAGKLLRLGEDGRPIDPPTIDSTGHLPHRDGNVTERGHGEIDGGQYERAEDVFGLTAAAVLFRKTMVEQISFEGELFDESFWAYKDDVDICWRAWRFGWKVRYVPTAVAHHRRGFTVTGPNVQRRRRISLRVRRHSFSNRYMVLLHNARCRDLLRNTPHLLWYEVRAAGWILLREREMLPAYLLVFRKVPRALAVRRDASGRRKTKADPWSRFVS